VQDFIETGNKIYGGHDDDLMGDAIHLEVKQVNSYKKGIGQGPSRTSEVVLSR
jgi:hypothetical protein